MEAELLNTVSSVTGGFFDLTNLILFLVLLLLLFSSAVISGSETGYFSLSPGQLEEIEQKGYTKILRLLKKPERLLATILISNNFVNVGIVILSSFLMESLFDFSDTPVLGFVIQVVVVTFFILLFGEIIPKLYANRYPVRMAAFMARPLNVLCWLMRPFADLLSNSTSIISRRVAQKNSISIDQLSKALELTKDSEINEEKDILEGIVRFSNIYAIDIIQPRINVVGIDTEETFGHVRERIVEHGYSRLPVYKENLDTIVGILYTKDLLAHLNESDDFRWQELARPAYFVPETKKINDLLEEFQTKKVHMAIVVDEYGGMSGIVTMEDILEEIVGEINDETDEKEKSYVKTKENTYIFEGHTLLNDFEKITDNEDDCFREIEGEADTLAGLILEIKGEMPRKNEVITYQKHKFTILEVDKRRIKKIKYEKGNDSGQKA